MTAARLLEHFDRVAEAPGAVPRLRRFILDLAVRGKLVAQDSRDEPAAELLTRITELKAERGEQRRSRRIVDAQSSDEPPFELPANWIWTRIRDVTSDRGQMVPDTAFTYIDVTSIDKEAGRIANPRVIAATEAPSRARKLVERGDVLYSCVRPYLLNIAVLDEVVKPRAIASTAFAVLMASVLYRHGFCGSRFAVRSWLRASKQECADRPTLPSMIPTSRCCHSPYLHSLNKTE